MEEVDHLLSLGWVNGSCPSFRMLATIHCIRVHGVRGACAMTKEEKYDEVRYIKNVVRDRLATVAPTVYHVTALPPKPATFFRNAPRDCRYGFWGGDAISTAVCRSIITRPSSWFSAAESADSGRTVLFSCACRRCQPAT